jgi:hypothetical protein
MLAHRWYLSDDGQTSQSIFTTKISRLKVAELISIDSYHITADVQEELSKLLEDGMSVKIESQAFAPMVVV